MEPDPKLLSLLEKVNNPIEKLEIQITVKVYINNKYNRVYMVLQMIGELQMKVILEYLQMLLNIKEKIYLEKLKQENWQKKRNMKNSKKIVKRIRKKQKVQKKKNQ